MAHAHILLVEDENITAKDITQRLKNFGYSVAAIASSGQDAIQKAADLHPDLVLMDIVLKGDMDGIEAAEHLRTRFQIPVVYLTAYADEGTLQRAMATEPFGYVLKPIIDRQLQTVIEIALSKQKMERKIAESEKWFSTTLRCVGDAVLTTNTDGHITFMNPMAEALTGWRQNDAHGANIEAVLPLVNEATRTPVANPVREAMRTGTVVTLGAPRPLLMTKDGDTIPIDDSAAPIRDDQGVTIGGVLVFRDVTERRQREDALLTARKLDAIGTLAGGIAHTFNNLLMVILGRLSLAKLYVRPKDSVYAQLNEAEAAVQLASEVTRQLLTFGKGGVPVKRLTTLGPLLQEATRFGLAGSQVQHVCILADDLWPAVVDGGQIRQVIHNVVLNAVEATALGGTIHVQADNVTLHGERHFPLSAGPYVRISIIDQGVGIPEAHLDKIFDPYFTTKERGSGLGLATAYAIIQKHGGHILLVSTPGTGTTVHIYLPARPEAVGHAKEATTLQIGQGKLLVMDDEEVTRNVLSQMLTHLGYEVETARDGAEAIVLYRHAQEAGAPFAAVILDLVVIGGMGGREAIAKLRELDPQIRAIVSSGYSDDAIMADFSHYGFRSVLPKPYKLAELSAVLQCVIHGTDL
jgi:two-component system cell cycle sensor histidine kinase/response regulator CckA